VFFLKLARLPVIFPLPTPKALKAIARFLLILNTFFAFLSSSSMTLDSRDRVVLSVIRLVVEALDMMCLDASSAATASSSARRRSYSCFRSLIIWLNALRYPSSLSGSVTNPSFLDVHVLENGRIVGSLGTDEGRSTTLSGTRGISGAEGSLMMATFAGAFSENGKPGDGSLPVAHSSSVLSSSTVLSKRGASRGRP